MIQDLVIGETLLVTEHAQFLLYAEGTIRLSQGCLLEVQQVVKQVNSANAFCRVLTGDSAYREIMLTYSRVHIHESLAIHFVRKISALELLAEQAP